MNSYNISFIYIWDILSDNFENHSTDFYESYASKYGTVHEVL